MQAGPRAEEFLRDKNDIEVHWRPKPDKTSSKSKKPSAPNQKHASKWIPAMVELYDENSSVDDSGNADETMEVEGSLQQKALSLTLTLPNRPEPRQEAAEKMDGEGAYRADTDTASSLYKQMCDLRQQVR